MLRRNMRPTKSSAPHTLTFLCLFVPLVSCAALLDTNSRPVWSPDNGDGTFKNPVIFADYSDPDVIRVGDDFYLTASSFNCVPGLPVLHSKDLVNWTIIGHVFQNYPFPEFNFPQHGDGVWAPSLRFHNGKFYIYFGDPDLGIFMSKAKNPAGPWSPLLRVKESKGWIDTCPFWNDDGQAYLVHAWARSRSGIKSILTINRMSADGTKLLDDGVMVFDDRTNPAHHRRPETLQTERLLLHLRARRRRVNGLADGSALDEHLRALRGQDCS